MPILAFANHQDFARYKFRPLTHIVKIKTGPPNRDYVILEDELLGEGRRADRKISTRFYYKYIRNEVQIIRVRILEIHRPLKIPPSRLCYIRRTAGRGRDRIDTPLIAWGNLPAAFLHPLWVNLKPAIARGPFRKPPHIEEIK